MSAALDYGVQSFCYRNFKDNAEVARKVLEIGVDKIEICAVHADFNDPQGWKEIVKTMETPGSQWSRSACRPSPARNRSGISSSALPSPGQSTFPVTFSSRATPSRSLWCAAGAANSAFASASTATAAITLADSPRC